jgi:hypothetical protein
VKYSSKLNRMKLELERLNEKIGDGKVLPVNYRKLFDRRKVLVEKLGEEERNFVKGVLK